MLEILRKFFRFCDERERSEFYRSIVLGVLAALFSALKIPAIGVMLQAILVEGVTAKTILLSLAVMLISVIGSSILKYRATALQTDGGYSTTANKRVQILWAGIHGYYVGLLFSRLYGTIGGHFCFYWWHNRRIHWKSRAEKALCQKRYNLMKSVLFGQKPTSRQLYLDARTKLILCLLTSFIMFSCNYTGVMRFVLPVLSALPFFSFLILKKYRTATGYILAYGICLFLPVVLRQYDAPFLNIMSAAIASIFTQMLPGLAMFNVLLSSTSVSEFIAAMDGFHISKKFSVPVSVMFRFFPTIREEYQFIRDALRLRGIGTLAHPSEMLEYRMVPLLTELVQVGNELSASAMTRGLDAPNKRTNVCRSGFHAQDIIAFVFCAVVIMLFIISKVLGL